MKGMKSMPDNNPKSIPRNKYLALPTGIIAAVVAEAIKDNDIEKYRDAVSAIVCRTDYGFESFRKLYVGLPTRQTLLETMSDITLAGLAGKALHDDDREAFNIIDAEITRRRKATPKTPAGEALATPLDQAQPMSFHEQLIRLTEKYSDARRELLAFLQNDLK
jgi:hypothetical protein